MERYVAVMGNLEYEVEVDVRITADKLSVSVPGFGTWTTKRLYEAVEEDEAIKAMQSGNRYDPS
ncbi:MAG: hypothetical protein DMG82_17495 [Acidobacteria bacterium]|nr:MAG: hypothetical protein DMG82_17495 [Acidobacteriota bacterium]PYX45413.1 MAG: hypothetical protein DMG83_09965 [Acidobacteriota bacterium]